jgi:hypothetical protein
VNGSGNLHTEKSGRESYFPTGFFYGENRDVTGQGGAACQVSTLKVYSPTEAEVRRGLKYLAHADSE